MLAEDEQAAAVVLQRGGEAIGDAGDSLRIRRLANPFQGGRAGPYARLFTEPQPRFFSLSSQLSNRSQEARQGGGRAPDQSVAMSMTKR